MMIREAGSKVHSDLRGIQDSLFEEYLSRQGPNPGERAFRQVGWHVMNNAEFDRELHSRGMRDSTGFQRLIDIERDRAKFDD